MTFLGDSRTPSTVTSGAPKIERSQDLVAESQSYVAAYPDSNPTVKSFTEGPSTFSHPLRYVKSGGGGRGNPSFFMSKIAFARRLCGGGRVGSRYMVSPALNWS